MSKVRRAVIFSSISQYGVKLIGLATMMIVARLLTPSEIGTFSIASAVVLMISEFKMLGAGPYLIREKELTEDIIRRTLGLTIITSWGLGTFILFAGPVVSNFYNLPPLSEIFSILSIGFFLAPFISIPFALMTRDFDFKLILIANFSGAIASLIVIVFLINMGFSYYSLAWGQVARITIQLAIIGIYPKYKSYYKPAFSRLGIIARFGIYNSLTSLFRNGVNLVPDIVIGKLGSTAQVGLFSRGMGLMDFLAGTVQKGAEPVVLPYLSETRRSGKNMVSAYILATVLATGFAWPVLAVASIASLPVIRLFFGDQWDAAAPIASALGVWLILRTTHNFANNFLITLGKEKIMIIKEAVLLITVLILVILAFPFGLHSVAGAFIILGLIEIILVTIILWRLFEFDFKFFLRSILPSIGVSFICSFVTWIISFFVSFNDEPPWKSVFILATLLPPIWLASLKLFRHPLYKEVASVVFKTKSKNYQR
ncbi:oligosaccharide flippase family protein [Marinobacter sp. F4216]|uniref:oligosaccharide flippase family protein n=1 Tax=Marinobacter sp. F4216 TaxID=2874281 RepID=UPI001CBB6763|nr:oligosaccharide flippase family protein [Marinobacter sp. F4216]MBZ2167683.1 oligosaccharide flippase family protein [Marinobacter sp. F4216]